MRIETKATMLGLAVSASVLGLTFGLSPLLQSTGTAITNRDPQANLSTAPDTTRPSDRAELGHDLFSRNCAHCHGDDARGDEGPNLHNLPLSDGRIAQRIKDGIKGEMPRFGGKLNDADIGALVSYLRTLKE